MKKFIFLIFLPSLASASGPLFRHKDTYVQQEFENVYQDVQRTSNASSNKVVNVLDYGAKGDGSTDDTVSIQTALNTCKSVYIPEANTNSYFRITTALNVVCDNQLIFGAGNLSKIVNTSASDVTSDVFLVTTHTGVSFENLNVIPSTTAMHVYNGFGFNIQYSSNVTVENCQVSRHLRGAIMLYNSNYNFILNNSIHNGWSVQFSSSNFFGCDIIVYESGSYNVIKGNIISNGCGCGIAVQTDLTPGNAGQFNNIEANQITNATIYGITLYKHFSTDIVENNSIIGNTINTVTGSARDSSDGNFYYGTGIYLQGAEMTRVIGNSIYNTNSTTASVTDQLAPSGIGMTNARTGIIQGNTIRKSNHFPSILVRDPNLSGYTTGYVLIDGNFLTDATFGIRIEDRGNVQANNNVIDNVTNYGLSADSPQNHLFNRQISAVGNSIRNSGGGMSINFSSSVIVSGNNISSCAAYGITIDSVTYGVISNNLIIHGDTASQASGMLFGPSASNVTVSQNFISKCTYGIVANSTQTMINNTIVGNTNQYAGTATLGISDIYNGSTKIFSIAQSSPYIHLGTDGDTSNISTRINGPTTTGASAATIANSPVAGNATLWLQININGTNRYVPAW